MGEEGGSLGPGQRLIMGHTWLSDGGILSFKEIFFLFFNFLIRNVNRRTRLFSRPFTRQTVRTP